MTPYELEFYEYSMIADDPKKLEKLQNHFFDPDFDEWLEEFEESESNNEESDDYSEYEVKDNQELDKNGQYEPLDLPDKETIEYAETLKNDHKNDVEYDDEFEVISSTEEEITDWERVYNE